ncbi:hypothetical protein AVEN_95382-1 [Araneus ventricosus]|uniref:Uncharacterized protein n=1 Tax=Araneus ventricosus TaxID=182803 RepID=A0A4Y2CGP2_ARAVE|nr:hypothetical protein AVEN_95382-1 [Araneus ventricosus]
MEGEYMVGMLIAEDIMKFLYSESAKSENLEWEPEWTFSTIVTGRMKMKWWYEELGFPEYDKVVGLAVRNLIKMKENLIKEIYDEFLDMFVLTGTDFASHALSASPIFFPEGYNNGRFLGYCAMVMGVALRYLSLPPSDIPRTACGVVSHVLFSHLLTGQFYEKGAWLGLYSTSKNFNECVADN